MKISHDSGKLLFPGELNITKDSSKGSKAYANEVFEKWIEQYPYELSNYKYNNIIETAIKYNCQNLVEFGTFVGNCSLYAHDKFEKIYTVEPVLEYFNEAKEKLSVFSNISLFNKKSLDFITEDLESIDNTKRTLFWVDDHIQPPYTQNASNDLFEVLNRLIQSPNIKNYVLLIDDYRLWNQFSEISDVISLLENNSTELYEKVDIVTFVP